MNETPGERLARMASVQSAESRDAQRHLRFGLENAVYGLALFDLQSKAVDRLALAFLASYGVEVPE